MPASNPRNFRIAREMTRDDILLALSRVPNSDRLYVGGSDFKVHEVDVSVTPPRSTPQADHGRYVTAVRVAGDFVISGGYDGRLLWWHREQRQLVREIQAHSRQVRQLAVSPDGNSIASIADDMVVNLWEVQTGRKTHELRGHAERTPTNFGSMLYACAFSNDGRYLATGDRIGHVVIWDVQQGFEAGSIEVPSLYTWDGVQRIRSIGGVRSLAFSPNGTQLAVGGVGQINNVDGIGTPSRVEVHQWQRREKLFDFTGANGIVKRMVWHPRNEWLCGIGGENAGWIFFHDTVNRTQIHRVNLPMHAHDFAFNEDFTKVYVAGDRKIAIGELIG